MSKNTHLGNEYLELWTEDDVFGLRMSNLNLEKMLKYCEKSFPDETGGILVGRYTKSLDCAVIEAITGPPIDSQSGRTWFKRGIKGLRKILEKYWKRNCFYVGEWHYHPDGEPFPSNKDKNQLKSICSSKDYDCSAPILIIVGGRLPVNWSIKAYVFPNNGNLQELKSANSGK